MTWINEQKLSWYERAAIDVVKAGRVPKHVAFIMDGNRRYASKQKLQKTEGHSRGFSKLAETLKWCRDLGINEVTVYAFSIENFRRSQEEVDGLMQLAREKLKLLIDERDKINKHSVCVRFIGNLTLLPVDLQLQIAFITMTTRHNNAAFLNVAFSYTAREEMSRAVRDMAEGVQAGLLQAEDVCEQLLDQCLYTRHSPHPHLLVRTSGEVRLSDFLLWQTTHTYIHFTDVLWPDFTLWHLLVAVFRYQRSFQQIEAARTSSSIMQQRVGNGDALGHSPLITSDTLQAHGERVQTFLTWLDNRRRQYFQQLSSQYSAA